ncbi:hypothetical protein MMC32_000985 [Xylographa parallela]|nr:hypothetical protein [Xylographa parallela]
MAVLYTLINDIIFQVVLVGEGLAPLSPNLINQLPFFLKVQFAIIVLFWTTLWAVKWSFLMYYRKLFVGLPGHMQHCWWGVVVFSVLAYLGCWVTQLLSCTPISTYFDDNCQTPRDIYISNLSLYYAMGVDVVCDILIMALPLRLLWGLKVNLQQKIALAAIFSLGFIIIAFAVVRVVETGATFKHVNPMWLALWSMIEASVAVIVSCLPSFRALFSSRSASNYKDHTPSSGSRLSRLSRTPKGAVRLETYASGGRGHVGFPQPDSNLTSDDLSRLTASPPNTGYTVGAEGLHRMDTMLRSGTDDESEEDILPIMPQNGVLVRNDFYMTSEIVDVSDLRWEH